MKKSLHKRTCIHASITLVLSIICSMSIAQTEGPDIVELKNGVIHQGTIIEQRPGQLLKLWQQPSNDTLLIQYADILVLRSVPSNEQAFNQNTYSLFFAYSLNGGSWHHHEFGAGILMRLTPRIQVGLGAYLQGGIPYFYNASVFTGEFKYVLQSSFDGRLSLVSSCSMGYVNFLNSERYEDNVNTYTSNGIYVSPSVGYRINFSKNIGMMIGLGYQYMGGTNRRKSNDEKLGTLHLSSLSVKASIFF